MRIQHNIAALNSHRQLGGNNTAVGKNLEKLSSGFRINKAGDDAAGLAISEKMRAQIKGLETATKNANDGISLVQTAEGALTEVHSMLNRMTELATQSANGTYDNKVDRANLQKEVASLLSEIDRISESTNYNGIQLLDGSLSGSGTGDGLTGASVATYKGAATGNITGVTGAAAKAATYVIDFTGLEATADQTVTYNGVTVTAGTTQGFAPANTAAENAAAIVDAWKADSKFDNYNIELNGLEVTLTAKTTGVDTAATTMGTDMTGDATIGSKEVAATAGAAATGSFAANFTVQDKLNVDGTDIKVDWSKLTADQQAVLKKDWTSAAADEKTAAAKLIQDTINESIKNNNTKYGSSVSNIKVTNDGTGFKFESTQKDANSSITLTGTTGSVLSLMTNTADDAEAADLKSASPIASLSGAAGDYNGEFKMTVDGEEISIKTSGIADAANVAERMQAAIDDALTRYDAQKGTTGSGDALKGKVNVKLNSTGALEFSNTTGKKIGFADKDGGEVAKTLGISAEGKAVANGGMTLQVGETSQDYQKVNVSIGDMSSNSLGIASINIGTQGGASAAMDKIKAAINSVSATRGDLGAIQNRLEHTISNLGVTTENMTAAESRIRDVDMAKEMMDFTKNNILIQASQAMLAQANQLPQGVLQLLG